MAEFRRIEALEDHPSAPLQHDAIRDPVDRLARLAPRYVACAARAYTAALLDEAERLLHAPLWAPEDCGERPFDQSFDITPAAVSARTYDDGAPTQTCDHTVIAATRAKPPPPGTDPRLIPPVSVTAARRLPDYAKPHGWKAAMQKEVTRVEGFGAWEIVPFREYRDMSRKYPGRTSIDCACIDVQG
jgi:hypothetical protein